MHSHDISLRPSERADAALDAVLKASVDEALADPAPSLAQEDVFAQLGARRDYLGISKLPR
ncbi:hypothetical protein [Novosphingobium endophyticum]|uniref:hypothetical protein n=1 Tax=Novosphingobium endophyticum TaxID=1955250 RepID=UPI0016665D3E|nr:hypothetical protein [Novosphingobium endophyticum]